MLIDNHVLKESGDPDATQWCYNQAVQDHWIYDNAIVYWVSGDSQVESSGMLSTDEAKFEFDKVPEANWPKILIENGIIIEMYGKEKYTFHFTTVTLRDEGI